MAKVFAQQLGGQVATLPNVDTVADVARALNINVRSYRATVNKEPADSDYELDDEDFVTFTKNIEGGTPSL